MLLSGAVCGLVYALFSGQPLTIVGATGPLLVFEGIVYDICEYVQILSTYAFTAVSFLSTCICENFQRKKDSSLKRNKTRSANPSRQCAEASKKSNSTLGMIRRTIVTRDKDTILRLYKTLVRPQLESCIQVWSPYLKQDMEKLEKVQRRATKMIQGYKYLSYEE